MSTDTLPDPKHAFLLPCVRVSDQLAPENPRLPKIEKKPPAPRKLSPEQQELIDIRVQCGLSQAQFAECYLSPLWSHLDGGLMAPLKSRANGATEIAAKGATRIAS